MHQIAYSEPTGLPVPLPVVPAILHLAGAAFGFVEGGQQAAMHHKKLLQIHSSYGTSSLSFMCEFCSFGPNTSSDPDSRHHQFAGFFSADAIEAAVRQAQQNEDLYSDEESDGT